MAPSVLTSTVIEQRRRPNVSLHELQTSIHKRRE